MGCHLNHMFHVFGGKVISTEGFAQLPFTYRHPQLFVFEQTCFVMFIKICLLLNDLISIWSQFTKMLRIPFYFCIFSSNFFSFLSPIFITIQPLLLLNCLTSLKNNLLFYGIFLHFLYKFVPRCCLSLFQVLLHFILFYCIRYIIFYILCI